MNLSDLYWVESCSDCMYKMLESSTWYWNMASLSTVPVTAVSDMAKISFHGINNVISKQQYVSLDSKCFVNSIKKWFKQPYWATTSSHLSILPLFGPWNWNTFKMISLWEALRESCCSNHITKAARSPRSHEKPDLICHLACPKHAEEKLKLLSQNQVLSGLRLELPRSTQQGIDCFRCSLSH